jgi:hypothetical protein
MRIHSVTPPPANLQSSAATQTPPRVKAFSEHVGHARGSGSTHTMNPPGGAASGSANSANPAEPMAGATVEAPSVTSSSPSGTAAGVTGATSNTSMAQSSLDQGEEQNMQYLQLQSQVNNQSETFTTLSNVMKTENDTIKNTAGNMAM